MTTVMIYSKGSSRCKNLFDRMSAANMPQFDDFKLLRIDHPEIRKKVRQDPRYDIKTVPCILNLYPSGEVEKYEDQDAFRYIETMIDKFAPPPKQTELPPKVIEPIHPSQDFERMRKDNEPINIREELPNRVEAVKRPEIIGQVGTPLEDLDEDRYKTPQQVVPRLRQNDHTYIESKELFPGEPLDNARELIKPVDKKINSGNNSMDKAHLMAQERERIEAEINKPARKL